MDDYQNDATMENIADLLREYQDLFPTMFLEMKQITGEIGEMNIHLKPYINPIREIPYKPNLKYKSKVKDEIDIILEA